MTNEEVVVSLSYLVGTRYVPTVKAYIAELTGRDRVHGPGEGVDKMMRPERVHIAVSNVGAITGFTFG